MGSVYANFYFINVPNNGVGDFASGCTGDKAPDGVELLDAVLFPETLLIFCSTRPSSSIFSQIFERGIRISKESTHNWIIFTKAAKEFPPVNEAAAAM